jgi:hypothetical protein
MVRRLTMWGVAVLVVPVFILSAAVPAWCQLEWMTGRIMEMEKEDKKPEEKGEGKTEHSQAGQDEEESEFSGKSRKNRDTDSGNVGKPES